MRADGHENVLREKVMVPHWLRGEEWARVIHPSAFELGMLGLGGSVGTNVEGIKGHVVVAKDFDDLDWLGSEGIKGKIVLFNNKMPPYDPVKGSGYGDAVQYRVHGASRAAAFGAVAVLVRSVTAYSLYTPHTGALRYDESHPKIPAAAITVEDAEHIARLVKMREPVMVHMRMAARTLEDVASANVVGELRGSTNPDEIVVIGGHLDSWDVGQGAHDDGGGCVIAMEAITVLRKLNLIPRRTIRVVLWTNEENGLRGAKAYVEQHKDELANHVAAIESDGGVFHPTGFSVECNDPECERRAVEQAKDMIRLLEPLGPMEIEVGHSGADVGPMRPSGVVLMGHQVDGSTYFNFHHSAADTIDKVDPVELSKNVAAMAVMAFVIADMPERMGKPAGEESAGSK
jgi:carboxypeptidase Q